MNIYIAIGVLYLIYTIYSRYKNAQANRPKMESPESPQMQSRTTDKEEGFFDKLKRLAEEAAEQQRQAQQQTAFPTQQAQPTGQEYPDEWIVTETGTRVHDLEGRKMMAEYLQSKETGNAYEGTIKEEYNRDQKIARTMDSKMVEEYNASHQQGRPISHMGHGHGVKKESTYKRVETRAKKQHPLKADLAGIKGIRKAIILKEIIERPNF
jgi:hypothetical protein